MQNTFIRGLVENNIDLVKKAPKTDFHNHSKFGYRLERIEEWIGYDLPRPPTRMNNLEGMIEYIESILNPFLTEVHAF